MKPTDQLREEHRVIKQVLDCLEKMAEQARREGTLDVASAGQAVDFFRNFADRCHHGKEEDHFFPAMEAKGFPREGGPTGVMLYEHEQGRARVRGMAEAVEAAASGQADAAARFARDAEAYIHLLRDHIEKEDHCLFAMAEQAFSERDHEALAEAFGRVEAEHMGLGTHEKYLRVADELAERFGVERTATRPPGCGGCGH
jgi:hemerythrin-like domain-containing protein